MYKARNLREWGFVQTCKPPKPKKGSFVQTYKPSKPKKGSFVLIYKPQKLKKTSFRSSWQLDLQFNLCSLKAGNFLKSAKNVINETRFTQRLNIASAEKRR